jgi:hypothetical protein
VTWSIVVYTPGTIDGSELTPFTVKSQAILSCTQFAIDYRNGSLSAVPLTPFIMSKKSRYE